MDAAFYPGSFNPLTYGHLNIIERALAQFDEVTVLVAVNPHKQPLFSIEESLDMIREATVGLGGIKFDSTAGLLVDYARRSGIHTAVRGLRAVTDFENEFAMALTNRSLMAEFDTVFLMTHSDYMYLSSSVVRQVAELGGDVTRFVPPCVERRLRAQFGA
jgi:pantetheine-phosphate adenylyltransferase